MVDRSFNLSYFRGFNDVIRAFYCQNKLMKKNKKLKRPFIFLSTAMSLDGKLSNHKHEQVGVATNDKKEMMYEHRIIADAVMVGGNTLIQDDPTLLVKTEARQKQRIKLGKLAEPIKVGIVSNADKLKVKGNFLDKGNTLKVIFTTTQTSGKKIEQLKGKAQVYVVIISFAHFDTNNKFIYDYETPKSEPIKMKVSNINPFLVDNIDFVVKSRNKPICDVPEISFGNMPNDGGNFLFTDEEKNEFLQKEPKSNKFFRPFISAKEYLNNKKRWCLWLKDASPTDLKQCPEVLKRIGNVKKLRSQSSREGTRKLAEYPMLFGEIRQPETGYILIPRVSSGNRKYIPKEQMKKNKNKDSKEDNRMPNNIQTQHQL